MILLREKTFKIFYFFFIIILLLSITQIVLSVILRKQVKSKLEKYEIKEVEDIYISPLLSINFTQDKTKPRYNPYNPNLGMAGELILDCYSGWCTEKKTKIEYERVCTPTYDDREECTTESYKKEYYENVRDYQCSSQCFELNGKECNNCNSSFNYINPKGKCTRNSNDKYSYEKYCLSDNVIYFWKGKRYEAQLIDYEYSYINNAVLKNEECPNKTKNCGILDDNENKLCVKDYLKCPINIISKEKLKNINSSFTVGNKTFYYGYDENAINKKIIGGLYVDTDIYLNEKEEDYIILDTYTISELLEDNNIIYKGVNLGFDPYKEKDIDQKGKSYLKIRYNSKKPDLISMKEDYKIYLNQKTLRSKLIIPVINFFSSFNLLGIIGYSYFIYILLCLIFGFSFMSKLRHQYNCLRCFILSSIPFFILTIIPLIKSCIIVGKLNEIGEKMGFSTTSLKIINFLFIILTILLYGIVIAFLIIFFIYKKSKNLQDKKAIKSDSETTINNLNDIINSNSSKPNPIQSKK